MKLIEKSIAQTEHMKKALVVFLSTVLLAGCGEETDVQQTDVVRPAKLIKVEKSSRFKDYTLPAIVEASVSRELTFQVSGQIQSMLVKEGDSIQKGQVIARLNQRSFKNNLQVAQARYNTAKIEFDRAKELLAENAIAKNIYDQRLANLDITRADLDNAKKQLEDTTLSSPFDGIVAVTHAKALQTVSPTASIITLDTFGEAQAVIKIPANTIALQQQFELLEVHMVLDVAPDYPIPAEMVEISTQANLRSQTFEAKLSFTPPEHITVFPGMTGSIKAKVEFDSSIQDSKISLPLNTILTDGKQQYVWLVDENTMRVSRQNIKTLPSVGEWLILESGLNEGDIIVGAGASYLHENMKIRSMKQ